MKINFFITKIITTANIIMNNLALIVVTEVPQSVWHCWSFGVRLSCTSVNSLNLKNVLAWKTKLFSKDGLSVLGDFSTFTSEGKSIERVSLNKYLG